MELIVIVFIGILAFGLLHGLLSRPPTQEIMWVPMPMPQQMQSNWIGDLFRNIVLIGLAVLILNWLLKGALF